MGTERQTQRAGWSSRLSVWSNDTASGPSGTRPDRCPGPVGNGDLRRFRGSALFPNVAVRMIPLCRRKPRPGRKLEKIIRVGSRNRGPCFSRQNYPGDRDSFAVSFRVLGVAGVSERWGVGVASGRWNSIGDCSGAHPVVLLDHPAEYLVIRLPGPENGDLVDLPYLVQPHDPAEPFLQQ